MDRDASKENPNMNFRIVGGALAVVMIAASAAMAGPGDSAVPSISASAATRVLFIAPGVIKNNGLETAFMCTSLDTVAVTIAVELFDPAGGGALNNVSSAVGNGTITIPAGGSGTISTGSSVGLHEDLAITGITNLKNGSARILGTSTQVLCTGVVVDKASATPNTFATIKIIARRKQNGD